MQLAAGPGLESELFLVLRPEWLCQDLGDCQDLNKPRAEPHGPRSHMQSPGVALPCGQDAQGVSGGLGGGWASVHLAGAELQDAPLRTSPGSRVRPSPGTRAKGREGFSAAAPPAAVTAASARWGQLPVRAPWPRLPSRFWACRTPGRETGHCGAAACEAKIKAARSGLGAPSG